MPASNIHLYGLETGYFFGRLNSRNTKLTRTINTQLYTKKNMLSPKEQDDNIHHILIFTSL